jgi:hypothetical protein
LAGAATPFALVLIAVGLQPGQRHTPHWGAEVEGRGGLQGNTVRK